MNTLRTNGPLALRYFMYLWFAVVVTAAIAVQVSKNNADAAVDPTARVLLTEREVHCLIATTLGEALPPTWKRDKSTWKIVNGKRVKVRGALRLRDTNRAEAVYIMRNMITRREMGRGDWGNTICSVVNADWQYSVWNNRTMPSRLNENSRLYGLYREYAEQAIAAGPHEFGWYWHPEALKKQTGRYSPRWAKDCIRTKRVGTAIFCQMKS